MYHKWLVEKACKFEGSTDVEKVEDLTGWIEFLVKEASADKVPVQIRDCTDWQHVPRDKPFQLEIPLVTDEFDSYILEFFPDAEEAKAFAEKHSLVLEE